MTFTLIVERDDTTGLLRGTLADTPQRAFQARTIAELKARANEVLSAEQGGTDGARSERSYMIAIRWKCPSGTHATVEHTAGWQGRYDAFINGDVWRNIVRPK